MLLVPMAPTRPAHAGGGVAAPVGLLPLVALPSPCTWLLACLCVSPCRVQAGLTQGPVAWGSTQGGGAVTEW